MTDFKRLIVFLLPFIASQGCNITLGPKHRFQYRGDGPCFFHLPNRIDHWIEIAFSSFHVGSIDNFTCSAASLRIAEEDGLYTSEGSFCGDLTSAQTYVTGSKSVTLYVNPERDTDHFNAYYDVLSQSHFLKRYNPLVKPISREAHPSAFGSCDITLHNCDSNCRISSPYYPSSYPRNMTCRYRVTFDRPQWRVALGGRSIDRYDLSHHADCAYDRLVVFEKIPGDDHYQEVAKFCGHGTFPQILARGGDVMVELTTSPSGLFHQGFHLSVSHRRGRKTANSTASILSPCNNVIDVSSQQHGWIASPRHWFPHNLNCTWSLTTNSSQQIWIEVHSSKPKKIVDTCFHRLEMKQPTGETEMLCESNDTRSYSVLAGNRVDIHFSSQVGSLNGLDFQFNMFYLLSSDKSGVIEGTICDRIFRSSRGQLQLLADRLLLKNHRHLKCNYHIEAPEGYRIELSVKQLKFDPIRQCGNVGDCSKDDRHFDSLIVWDREILRCFCRTSNGTRMLSTSNRVTLQLHLMHIFEEAYKDFDMYHFDIDYAWAVNDCGQPTSLGNSGSIHRVGKWLKQSCSWLIDVPDNERILFKINSFTGKDCRSNGLILRYHGQGLREEHQLCRPDGEYISTFPLRFFYVQLLSDQPQSWFHLEWNVLHVPSETNPYVCPNSSWAIPSDLVCNRKINCPQRQLYGYLLDEEKCKSGNQLLQAQSWVLIFILGLTISLVVILITVFAHFRKRMKDLSE